MDPHSFLADPDPDPGGKMNADPCGSGSRSSLTNFEKNNLMEFSIVVKYIKDYSKVRNIEALCKFTLKI